MALESVQRAYRDGHYLDFTETAWRDPQGRITIPVCDIHGDLNHHFIVIW